MSTPDPIVQVTKYTVNCLPEDDDSHVFGITVEYRGQGRWGIFRGELCCLGADGEWSWGHDWTGGEPQTEAEWDAYHTSRDAWLAAHRFDEQTALRLAKAKAPHITVNGFTVTDALRMAEKRKANR